MNRVCADTGIVRCVALLLLVDDAGVPLEEDEDDEELDEADDRIASCAIPSTLRPV